MWFRSSLFMILIAVGCSGSAPQRGPANVDPEGFAGRLQWLCGWGEPASVSSACVERESLAHDEPEPEAEKRSPGKASKPAGKRPKAPALSDRKPAVPASASAAPVKNPVPEASAPPPPPKPVPPPPPAPPSDTDDEPSMPPDFPIE